MNWAHTAYLETLWIIPISIFFFIIGRKRELNFLKNTVDSHLREQFHTKSYKKETVQFYLFLSALTFLILATSGPRWGLRPKPIKGKGIDIMFAIDASKSMYCEDVKPNRMTIAKLVLSSLIDKLAGIGRVGITAFGGDGYPMCPLTTDFATAKLYLSTIEPGFIPSPGTDLQRAIEVSAGAFSSNKRYGKVIILITDGDNLQGNPISAAKEAAKKGIRIYTVAVGTPEGAPVPIIDSTGTLKGYKKDKKGNPIISRANISVLKGITEAGGGKFIYLSPQGYNMLYGELKRLKRHNLKGESQTDLQEKYQYFLGISILLFILALFINKRKRIKP